MCSKQSHKQQNDTLITDSAVKEQLYNSHYGIITLLLCAHNLINRQMKLT